MIYAEVLVIGGGIFGQVISRELISRGMGVMLVDAGRKDAGSPASSFCMRSSKTGLLSKAVSDPALELLHRHYEIKKIKFHLHSNKFEDVLAIEPNELISVPVGKIEVTNIEGNVAYSNVGQIQADTIIIAAGAWSNELAPIPELERYSSVSFVWHVGDRFTFHPSIKTTKPWAHYKEIMAFKRSQNELWVSDGTFTRVQEWSKGKQEELLHQCVQSINGHDSFRLCKMSRAIHGIHSFVAARNPCYLERKSECLWVATGGCKHGLLAAAWSAHTIAEELC